MLVALLLPAVQNVRRSGIKTQCLNNVKQLSLALLSHESSKGQFPGYAQFVKRGNRAYATLGPQDPEGFYTVATKEASAPADFINIDPISWAAILLPRVERQDIWDQLVDDTATNLLIRPVEVFICPADNDVTSRPNIAGLTYIVNTGIWDWNRNHEFLGDTTYNGVFLNNAGFQRVGKKPLSTRLSSIKDGAATTLMLSENIHKDYDPVPSSATFTWLSSSITPEHIASE